MDENLQNLSQNKPQTSENPFTSKVVVLAVALSLVFGSFGGALGTYLLLTSPKIQKFFDSTTGTVVSQKIILNEESGLIDVVKKSRSAVVSIVVSKDISEFSTNPFLNDPFFEFYFGQQESNEPNIQQVGAGSGFFVSGDGLIFTNKHVVSDEAASYQVITQDGKKYDAKVLALDPRGDLAIIKVEINNVPFLILGDSGSLQIGQRVVAIGNSLGQYQNTVTSGIVSGIGRSIVAGGQGQSENLSGVIQTDAAINPGNSGGPLLNLAGQVVGINTAIDQQGQLVGFAIPANEAAKALASFNKSGKISRPYLGVRYVIINEDFAKEQNLQRTYGALLIHGQTANQNAVLDDSPAQKAGLKEGDIILEINGKRIDEQNTLSEALKNFEVGDSVSLKVFSGDSEKTVNVRLEESK